MAKTKAPPLPPPVTVCIDDTAYTPRSVNVTTGGKVIFKNDGTTAHTVTFVNFGTDAPDNSGAINPGEEFEVTFPTAGIWGYGCDHNPNMTGEVVVTD